MPGESKSGAEGRGWRWRFAGWAAVIAFTLLIPLAAMQISDEWNWGLFDFVFAGTVLFGAALGYELVAGIGRTAAYRAAVALAIATSVFLVWVNAAVGIIGDAGSINSMYFGVLAVGLIGALFARLRAPGMARALFAMAIAQMTVPAIVLAIPGLRDSLMEPPGAVGVFVLNAIFAVLWNGSAWLFRRAARDRDSGGRRAWA